MHPAMTSGPAIKLQEAWTYHGMAIFFSATRQQFDAAEEMFTWFFRSPGLGKCRNTHGRKARWKLFKTQYGREKYSELYTFWNRTAQPAQGSATGPATYSGLKLGSSLNLPGCLAEEGPVKLVAFGGQHPFSADGSKIVDPCRSLGVDPESSS